MGDIQLKKKDINAQDLLSNLDGLETEISDSTRKLVRKIQRERQTVQKYTYDLDATGNEIWCVKERIMNLKEKKIQNENHLSSAQKKIENLKSSNKQLRNKLIMLEKEKERVTKSCKKQEEDMRSKITFHQGKWHEKYGARFSNDPSVQEKQKRVSELSALKEKLCSLNEEEKKYEKELFQAKCEKNRRSSKESNIYPFKNFVINIAKIFLEGRKLYAECEKTSEAIAAVENKIKNHLLEKEIQLLNNTTPKPQTIGTVDENLRHGTTDDMNFPKHAIVDQNEFHETSIRKQISVKNVEFQRNLCEKNSNYSENMENRHKFIKSLEMPSKIPQSDNFQCKSNSFQTDSLVSKSEKPIAKGPKVRKWLEKLKIFVPKFSTTFEETYKPDAIEDTRDKFTLPDNKMEKEPTKEQLKLENLPAPSISRKNNDSKGEPNLPRVSTRQEHLTSSLKIMNDSDASKFEVKNVTPEVSKINTSKYFIKSDAGKYDKNLDASKKAEAVKLMTGQSIKQMVAEDAMDTDVSQKGFQNSTMCEPMDTGEVFKKTEKVCLKQSLNETAIAEVSVERIGPCPVLESRDNKMSNFCFKSPEPTSTLKASRLKGDITHQQDQVSAMEVDEKPTDKQNDLKNEKSEKMDTATTVVVAEDMVHELSGEHPPQKPQDINVNVIKASENIESESNIERSAEINVNAETKSRLPLLINRADNASKRVINSSAPASDPVTSPMEPTQKSAESISNVYAALDSNPKTPLTRQLLSSAAPTGVNAPSSSSFNPDSMSPGFAYPTRLMFQAAGTSSDPPGNVPRDIFAQMAFLQSSTGNPIDFAQFQSPEDKTEFLASAYEDYLEDSPPVIKGTEKSMFAFVDSPDSPENEGKDDFFPLFAAGKESDEDKKGAKAQFSFNFNSSNQPQSPEENPGFKFLF